MKQILKVVYKLSELDGEIIHASKDISIIYLRSLQGTDVKYREFIRKTKYTRENNTFTVYIDISEPTCVGVLLNELSKKVNLWNQKIMPH